MDLRISNKTIFYLVLIFILVFFINFLPGTASAATISRPPTNLGLVGYWSLDDGGGIIANDVSGNAHYGDITGATWTNGRRGKALNFDGIDDGVSLSSAGLNWSTYFSSSLDFTISAWIKPNSLGYFALVSQRYGDAMVFGMGDGVVFPAGRLFLNMDDTRASSPYSTGALTAGVWQHVTVTYTGSDASCAVTFYINGVSSGTGTSCDGNGIDPQDLLFLGYQTRTGIGGPDSYYSGQMDDVRLYNRALSASEVSSIYKYGQTTRKQVSNSGLVGYWSFNEGGGLAASDSGGGGNNATVNGATWTDGRRGKALSFNGASSYVSSPTISIANTITASAWVYSTNFSQNGFVIGKNNVNEQWELFFEATLLRWRGGAPITDTTYCNIPTNSQWHHIAATQSGTDASLYIDGVLCDTGTVTAIANGSGTIDIGRFNGGYYFNGKIDDVRLYNRALSAVEILALYKQNETKLNSSQNGKLTNGLVGLWSFDGADVSGSTVYDRSVSGRNSTLYGNPNMTIGKMGQAANFNGTSQYTTASGFSEPGTSNQPYTFAAWVRPAANETTGNIIHMSARADGLGWCIPPLTISSNKAKAESWTRGQVSVTGTTDVPSGSWTHVATTWDATGGLKIYVNGTLDNSTPQATYSASGGSNYIWIAYSAGSCSGDSGDFDGDVDDVRIYSRALSASEMKQLYLMGK